MKLRDEHVRSYVDDIKDVGLIKFLTWKGLDVAPTWVGEFEPATRSEDKDLFSMARFSRDHYLFYRALVERHVLQEGSILDIGCGTGARTAMLARYAKNVIGLDSDPLKVSAASSLNATANVEWHFAEFMEWSQHHTGKFDYLFCVEVIEHIPLEAQRSFLATAMSMVSKGGALLLTTPKDVNPERKHPHIGLWEHEHAERRAKEIGAEIHYFNVSLLRDGGERPWSDKASATHYVLVARRSE